MTDKVQKILSEIATRKLCTMDEHMAFYNDKAKEDYRLLSDIEEFIKALQKEPVSEDLEKAIDTYLATYFGGEKEKQDWPFLKKMAIYFAKWQKEKDAKILEFVITNGKDYPTLDSFLNTFKMMQYEKIKM